MGGEGWGVGGGGGGIPQHKPAIGVCAACMDLVF